MEELRSTEVLDKEIRADSQRKAERILANARETADKFVKGVEDRVSEAVQKAQKQSDARLEMFKSNLDAALPLEKQRYLVSYIYDSVVGAMNEYFEKIGEKKRLDILKKIAEEKAELVQNQEVNALVVGLNLSDAKKMLKTVYGTNLKKAEEGNLLLLNGELVEGFSFHEGVIVKTSDGKITLRITLDEFVKKLLNEKREVLAKTLFSGRLPE